MSELIPGSTDASTEKHLPVISIEGNIVTVNIGSVPHPMEEKHFIEWVYLRTSRGGQRKSFKLGDQPKISFALLNDEALAAYAYCNTHGLWMVEL